MNAYRIGLVLVKPIEAEERGLVDRENFILKQIRAFNEKSLRSPINPKYIGLGENNDDNIQITRTTLSVTLYTRESLTVPGKALRLLSQLLITSNEEDNLACFVTEQKLFRTFKVATPNGANALDDIVDISEFSDSDLIKALVDFACDTKDLSALKRNAVDQMKKIAIESGLLTLKINIPLP